ncbi:MAG: dihydrofolate synthase/folylpolyglutamate synthase [Gammaproteobacteria bacterium]|jgi:dihydrofolate synthase/folylpolyglutamate synthase
MSQRSLAEWLCWQETLNPLEIDLGLDRVREVAERLNLRPPEGSVFLVAGTNGKGSVVSALHAVCHGQGLRTGTYTSPHLLRYNERVCLSGEPVADQQFVDAFEAIEAVRGELPLTYFEYGTLAAFWILSRVPVDVWIIEVGLGGRLDATNVIEPDFSLITTIDFDHQLFLGTTLAEIAREKAGVLRGAGYGFFGDPNMPATIADVADGLRANLHRQEVDFGFKIDGASWSFWGAGLQMKGLPLPLGCPQVQLQNQSLALAAIEAWRPGLLDDSAAVARALVGSIPAGRFQTLATNDAGGITKALEWVLDVGHNPQALRVLAQNLDALPPRRLTAVLGMLADKDVGAIVEAFAGRVERWIVTDVSSARGQSARVLAEKLNALGIDAHIEPIHAAAFAQAVETTPEGGRILVFGSFFVVGPAMQWLGML